MMTRQIGFGLLALICLMGADWRQFRGSDSSAVATEAAPTEFGPEKNIAWKVDLPGRGLSSPVVVGDRVFVTCSSGTRQDRLHVLAFDAKTGGALWQRSFWATGPTASHPKSCMAAPSPATDGQRLVALFATNDLVCLDLAGNVLWIRSLHEENAGATDGRGLASSPLVLGGVVVVHVENQNKSFAAGISLSSGENLWRIERARELNWSSPIAIPGKKADETLVLLQGSTRLSAHDPKTGKEIWGMDRASDPIASSSVLGKTLFVPGEKGLLALELNADQPSPTMLWEKLKLSPVTASPVAFDGKVVCLRGAMLATGDAKTGEIQGQLRLKGAFSSSPVVAGGLIYLFNEDGLASVVKPDGKDGQLLGMYPLGEQILCTPAVAGGAIYVRSDGHLWKIAKS